MRQPLQRRFDLIVSAMALHHVEDTAALARALHARRALIRPVLEALNTMEILAGLVFHDTGPDTKVSITMALTGMR